MHATTVSYQDVYAKCPTIFLIFRDQGAANFLTAPLTRHDFYWLTKGLACPAEAQEQVRGIADEYAAWLTGFSKEHITYGETLLLTPPYLHGRMVAVPLEAVPILRSHVPQESQQDDHQEYPNSVGFHEPGTELLVIGVPDPSRLWQSLDPTFQQFMIKFALNHVGASTNLEASAQQITQELHLKLTVHEEVTHLVQNQKLPIEVKEVLVRWIRHQIPRSIYPLPPDILTARCYKFVQNLVDKYGEDRILALNFGTQLGFEPKSKFTQAELDEPLQAILAAAPDLFADSDYSFASQP